MHHALVFAAVLLASAVCHANPVWPGLVSHGSGWSLADRPDTSGDPVLCIVDSLSPADDGALNTDYDGRGISVYEGSLLYCFRLDNGERGKIIVNAVSGTIAHPSGGFWILTNTNHWTLVDLDHGPAPSAGAYGGLLLKNTKLAAGNMSHFYLRNFRSFHGAGCGGDTNTGCSNRKSMSFGPDGSEDVLEYVVIDHCTFAYGIDGPVGIGPGDSDHGTNYIDFLNNIVFDPLKYDFPDWSSTTEYHPMDRVTYDSGQYECTATNTNQPPPDTDYWRAGCTSDRKSFGFYSGNVSNNLQIVRYGTVLYNIFANSEYRSPLDAGAQQSLYANNLTFNCAIYNMDVYSGRAYHSVSIIGNVALGGPDSGTVAETKYPTICIQGSDIYYGEEIATGEASAGTTSTLTDSTKSWSDDALVGDLIRISGDPGATHFWREIVGNTGTTLTIAGSWPETIGAGSDYVIEDFDAHEMYVADNTAIEYPSSTEYAQDTLANIYDWDYVNDRPNFESAFKATAPPPGTIPDGWTAMDDDDVIAYTTANAGAYVSNRDPETQRIIDDITSRTSTKRLRTTVTDDDFPTIEVAGPITLDLPADLWGDNDCDGYLNMEEWLHGTFDHSAQCDADGGPGDDGGAADGGGPDAGDPGIAGDAGSGDAGSGDAGSGDAGVPGDTGLSGDRSDPANGDLQGGCGCRSTGDLVWLLFLGLLVPIRLSRAHP